MRDARQDWPNSKQSLLFHFEFQTFEMSSKTPPRDFTSDSLVQMVQPSPTINTKEALSLMQQMWGKSNDSNRK